MKTALIIQIDPAEYERIDREADEKTAGNCDAVDVIQDSLERVFGIGKVDVKYFGRE